MYFLADEKRSLCNVKRSNSLELLGTRIVVTGMAGAGKSTFSKKLALQTGLPLIHLDMHSWKPGWVRVSQNELLQKQHRLLSADEWIVDSNDVDDDLLVQRAHTLIVLATPWWLCSWRAFVRGLRRPPGSELPEGCEESFLQRAGDEWSIVWRNWRNRELVPRRDLALVKRCQDKLKVHVFNSKLQLTHFLSSIEANS